MIKPELGLHFVTASKCLAHHQLEGIAVQQQLEVRLLAITPQDSAGYIACFGVFVTRLQTNVVVLLA